MVSVWLIVTATLIAFTRVVGQYLTRVDEMGLRGSSAATTPLRSVTFSFAADAQTWIRYALQLDETKKIQLRHTNLDNAPYGREVHWNSAWAWVIAGAGQLRRCFTREALPLATERATLWINPLVLFLLAVSFSGWVAARGGALAGALVAFGMLGCNRFYEGFIPTYVDHHGLLTASVFGMTLGAMYMGAGWWSPDPSRVLLPNSADAVRRAAIFSAVSGAIGLWISAASVVPAIAFVGLAGLGTVMARGRFALSDGISFDARAWRIWGMTGCVLSLAFYALEYAPAHLSMRLEVNHPLYAMAWWAGAETVVQASERRLGLWECTRGNLARLLCAIAVLFVVPAVILIFREAVFLPMDPFLSALHRAIGEFFSIWQRIHIWGWSQVFASFDQTTFVFLVGVGVLFYRRRDANVVLCFSALASAEFVGLGLWQERWLLNASGPLICMTLVTIATIAQSWRLLRSPFSVVLIISLLFVPTTVNRLHNFAVMSRGEIDAKDALQPLFRSVAAALRTSQPEGDIVLLASPNASTSIGYYGRFKTIGTLYWENDEGLKAAARIFSAHSDDEAAKLIKQRGITHIAMISEENFVAPYYALLHPGAAESDVKRSFGYRLLVDGNFPPWLEVLPYIVPSDLQPLNIRVLLFKVDFNQTVPDAVYHLAVAQMAWGAKDAADKTLDRLTQLVPNAPQPWLRKCELLMSEEKFGAAAVAVEKGIMLAPETDRSRLYNQAGRAFFEKHATSLAAQMYRNALALGFDPVATYSLSWLLATSKDASIRNGAEALRLAQEVVKVDPHSMGYLNCLAAALAECGRYDEAVEVAKQAIDTAGNDSPALPVLNAHLAAFQNHQPWRE